MIVAALLIALQCADGAPPPCRGVAAAPGANSVAVLYFDNGSRDSADAYLADGLTEEIILRLQQVRRLEVKSRYESQRVRGRRGQTPAALGRTLQARYLVNGSVQRAGERIVVRVELTRADRAVGVWSERFDRTSASVLDVIDDVARGVATGQLLPAEAADLSRRPTADPAAYQHLLRGNFYLAQRSPASLVIAANEFREAARRDPGLKAAVAREAYAYSIGLGHGFGDVPEAVLLARADSAVRRAIAVAPELSDSWLAHGFYMVIRTFVAGEDSLARGVASLRRAVELDSTSAEASHQYGQVLVFTSRYDEARVAYRRALALEPGRAVTWQELAYLELYQEYYREAARLADSAVSIDPRMFRGYVAQSRAAIGMRDLASAERAAATAEDLGRDQPGRDEDLVALRAWLVLARGDTALARRYVEGDVRAWSLEVWLHLARPGEIVDGLNRVQMKAVRCWAAGLPVARRQRDPRLEQILAACR